MGTDASTLSDLIRPRDARQTIGSDTPRNRARDRRTSMPSRLFLFLFALASLSGLAQGHPRRLQGAPFIHPNFGIGKLFSAAASDVLQGASGSITDAATNTYHSIV